MRIRWRISIYTDTYAHSGTDAYVIPNIHEQKIKHPHMTTQYMKNASNLFLSENVECSGYCLMLIILAIAERLRTASVSNAHIHLHVYCIYILFIYIYINIYFHRK